MLRRFCLLLPLFILSSCLTDYEVDTPLQLVVEGWIDSGDFPVVIVTTTVPVTEERQELDELGQYILRWARVAISDGEEEVVLTGKLDRRYFPPYVYTTSRLRGKPGVRYHLTVDYKDFHAEAETTIPQPVPLDSLRVSRCHDSDTLYQVHAFFHDDLAERRYYKFFTCMGRRSRMFFSSYMQTLSNEVFAPGEEVEANVYKGRLVTERDTYVPYFKESDTLLVKFASMDSLSFRFWEQMERNMTLGNFPMTSVKKNPQTNIRGGLGYWCGYGAMVYPIVIADSIRRP